MSQSCFSASVTASLLLGAAATACSPSLNAIQPSSDDSAGSCLKQSVLVGV